MPRRIGYSTSLENFPGSDIGGDEWEFLSAMAEYQRRTGRRYPSWREVLGVLRALGYRRVAEPVPLPKAKAKANAGRGNPSPQPPPRSGEGGPDPTDTVGESAGSPSPLRGGVGEGLPPSNH